MQGDGLKLFSLAKTCIIIIVLAIISVVSTRIAIHLGPIQELLDTSPNVTKSPRLPRASALEAAHK